VRTRHSCGSVHSQHTAPLSCKHPSSLAPCTSNLRYSTFARKYVSASSTTSSPAPQKDSDRGRKAPCCSATQGCAHRGVPASRVAPSVRFAGPRVLVFSGSSAKPQACCLPWEGTAEWYTMWQLHAPPRGHGAVKTRMRVRCAKSSTWWGTRKTGRARGAELTSAHTCNATLSPSALRLALFLLEKCSLRNTCQVESHGGHLHRACCSSDASPSSAARLKQPRAQLSPTHQAQSGSRWWTRSQGALADDGTPFVNLPNVADSLCTRSLLRRKKRLTYYWHEASGRTTALGELPPSNQAPQLMHARPPTTFARSLVEMASFGVGITFAFAAARAVFG